MAGQVGVYAGVMYSEYQLFGAEASLQGKRFGIPGSVASIANRVSYALDLHGPSMTLDTMCSSSLTAIHLACQDLNLGRTSMAIAGGVNVTVKSRREFDGEIAAPKPNGHATTTPTADGDAQPH